jgi:hypothetical protein
VLITGCSSDEAPSPTSSESTPPSESASPSITDVAPETLTGTMTLNPVSWTDIKSSSGQTESRDGLFSGRMDLEADGPLSGTIMLSASTSTLGSSAPPSLQHAWGTAEANLNGVPCVGTFAWTFFRQPPSTGGSLHLRCEDDRVLAAGLAVTKITEPPSGGTWSYTVRLKDGFSVAG